MWRGRHQLITVLSSTLPVLSPTSFPNQSTAARGGGELCRQRLPADQPLIHLHGWAGALQGHGDETLGK